MTEHREPRHTNRIHKVAGGILLGWLLCAALAGTALSSDVGGVRFEPVDPSRVEVGGEIGRRVDLTIRNNVLALDVDGDFLKPFRDKNRVANQKHAQRYVGLGKLIDALVTFSVHTKDPKVVALKDRVIDGLLEAQLPDGYVGIFDEKHRVFTLWDLHEMVYLIQGLVADYEKCGDQKSLDAARKLGDYIIAHRKSTDKPRAVGKLGTERAFIALHRATGQQRYLDYGVGGMDLRHWNAPVQGHAYTFMNVCLAQLDLYHAKPDPKLLEQSHRVIDLLLAGDALLVSGTCTRHEGFRSDQRVDGNSAETCATAYLIRLLGNLLSIEGKSLYGDVMERAVYNALAAAQLPDGRRLRYFTPLEGKRPVYQYDTYCCPNNFRRIVAELPSMIYYRSDGGLVVNLYTTSSAVVPLGDGLEVKIRQETDYPNSGKVTIRLDPSRPARFPLRLRIPAWCPDATASVNGQKLEQAVTPGTFLVIDRQWTSGDRVELDMPMPWRLVRGRKLQKGRVAVMRGPMLFCLDQQRLVSMNPQLAAEIEKMPDTAQGRKARQAFLTKIVRGLLLDPGSLGQPVADGSARGKGLACLARAWSPTASPSDPPDLELLLTEFADPGGTATYFLVLDLSGAVDDELMVRDQ